MVFKGTGKRGVRAKSILVFSLVSILVTGCGKEKEKSSDNVRTTATLATVEKTEITTEITTEATTEVTTEATSETTTEVTTETTTETTTEATTEATTEEGPRFSDSLQIVVEDNKASTSFYSLDTIIHITIYGPEAEKLVRDTADLIDKMDAIVSPFRDDSEISVYNKDQDNSKLSSDLMLLLERGAEISKYTNNYFSMVLLDGSDDKTIHLDDIYKGYVADKITEFLGDKSENEMTGAVIGLGGDALCIGTKPGEKPWMVGIQDPKGEYNDTIAVLSVDGNPVIDSTPMIVATKGIYGERTWDNNVNDDHGVTDPKTGKLAESDIVSASIIADDCIMADAMGAAIVLMGYDEAVKYWRDHSEEFEMVLADKDNVVYVTEGMKDNITSEFQIQVIYKEEQ